MVRLRVGEVARVGGNASDRRERRPDRSRPCDRGRRTMTFRERAHKIAVNQSKQAVKLLDRTASDFLSMPWPNLDAVVAGMSAGDIWFIGGFSGDGKTTALTSAVDCWYEAEKR